MKKKRKLKAFVLPTAYVIGVTILFVGIMYIGSNIKSKYSQSPKLVKEVFKDESTPVVNIEEEKAIKPYNSEKVNISKYFYSKDADDTSKENSIIYYENTYMQNTGLLYSSDEQFDVIASLKGTITNIKDDNILGKVIFVEYNTKITLVYYSLENTDLKIGDQVDQGAILGKSGTNKLENSQKYSLLFEVYIDGNLVNPLDFFEMNITDLMN